MSLKIEIDDKQVGSVDTRTGNKNGRDWSITIQSIWMYQPGSKFPVEISFVLPEDVNNYPAGEYTLDLDMAVEQGNFKSLVLNTRLLRLIPVSEKGFIKK